MQYVFIFSVFPVVMAAVSEVSLCQVPVGVTPVFEADKLSKNTLRNLDGSLSHTHTDSHTCTGISRIHTHTQAKGVHRHKVQYLEWLGGFASKCSNQCWWDGTFSIVRLFYVFNIHIILHVCVCIYMYKRLSIKPSSSDCPALLCIMGKIVRV